MFFNLFKQELAQIVITVSCHLHHLFVPFYLKEENGVGESCSTSFSNCSKVVSTATWFFEVNGLQMLASRRHMQILCKPSPVQSVFWSRFLVLSACHFVARRVSSSLPCHVVCFTVHTVLTFWWFLSWNWLVVNLKVCSRICRNKFGRCCVPRRSKFLKIRFIV